MKKCIDRLCSIFNKKAFLTEHVSKLNLAIPIIHKEAELTKDAIIQSLTPFATGVHTINFDNDREFCPHSEISYTSLG